MVAALSLAVAMASSVQVQEKDPFTEAEKILLYGYILHHLDSRWKDTKNIYVTDPISDSTLVALRRIDSRLRVGSFIDYRAYLFLISEGIGEKDRRLVLASIDQERPRPNTVYVDRDTQDFSLFIRRDKGKLKLETASTRAVPDEAWFVAYASFLPKERDGQKLFVDAAPSVMKILKKRGYAVEHDDEFRQSQQHPKGDYTVFIGGAVWLDDHRIWLSGHTFYRRSAVNEAMESSGPMLLTKTKHGWTCKQLPGWGGE